ncbi:F-box family protein [Striga asiatica]|uniref:F-box family protein n=1 Tax=Striga asiatica TaxID=4170 RepID=A0A5A7RD69_STRAF|nr:F-box family protein [Striga asiatica]
MGSGSSSTTVLHRMKSAFFTSEKALWITRCIGDEVSVSWRNDIKSFGSNGFTPVHKETNTSPYFRATSYPQVEEVSATKQAGRGSKPTSSPTISSTWAGNTWIRPIINCSWCKDRSNDRGNPSLIVLYRMSRPDPRARANKSSPSILLADVMIRWWMNWVLTKVMTKHLAARCRASWTEGFMWPWKGGGIMMMCGGCCPRMSDWAELSHQLPDISHCHCLYLQFK